MRGSEAMVTKCVVDVPAGFGGGKESHLPDFDAIAEVRAHSYIHSDSEFGDIGCCHFLDCESDCSRHCRIAGIANGDLLVADSGVVLAVKPEGAVEAVVGIGDSSLGYAAAGGVVDAFRTQHIAAGHTLDEVDSHFVDWSIGSDDQIPS
jgi:hypothetical protein